MEPEGWIAGAAFIVSACALWLAWRTEARGQIAARTQLFLDLRTRFLSVLEQLPAAYRDPDWHATEPAERAAAIRYWFHAFDEWYVIRRLYPKLMRQLWHEFYAQAILAGLRHTGLRETLLEMLAQDPQPAELWQLFRRDLESLWAADHPRNGAACRGLACEHGSR